MMRFLAACISLQVFAATTILVGIVATREEDYLWEHPLKTQQRVSKEARVSAMASVVADSPNNAAAGGGKGPIGEEEGGDSTSATAQGFAKDVQQKQDDASSRAGQDEADGMVDEIKYPYPFYKLSLDDGGGRWDWPGAGWASRERLTVQVHLPPLHSHGLTSHA